MDEQEALLNRLKASQAYNDHIVSQQASIIKQFDKVDDLNDKVTYFENQSNNFEKLLVQVQQDHYELGVVLGVKFKDSDRCRDDMVRDIGEAHKNHQELKSAYTLLIPQILTSIKELKDSLEAFKSRWLSEVINLHEIIGQHKSDVSQQLKEGMEENLKAIPETPPYIQDLKDTITHKMRIFELSTAEAVDKANHAEMLYKVVEKRTRQ